MNKCLVALWLVLFPLWALAGSAVGGSSLNLTPPASDYSVVFLGNLFGVVDGVLHGTGSQIMGAIFTVFNAAVLALGGIIIMYTLIVGTMNTAHEGEMLGHKWSSIWIPVRSTAGLALLIPKASGYCLMQIFVMWVVVQGVGAADKVWNAALDYLNRGGIIIQASISNPAATASNNGYNIPKGAANILVSEVCMLAVQKKLESVRKDYLALANDTPALGPCGPNKATNGMAGFCNTPVPDLLATVDAVAFQSADNGINTTAKLLTMPVPYFDGMSASPYAFLKGICGSISWNTLGVVTKAPTQDNAATGYQVSADVVSQYEAISLTRASAVQQMYMDYQFLAQAMVNNDPLIVPPSNETKTQAWPKQANNSFGAINSFGVAYSQSTSRPCEANTTDCTLWQGGFDSQNKSTTSLFNGTEFQGGMADYYGVMLPTLNYLSKYASLNAANDARAFIANAKSQGWLSAGSYFFDLAALNRADLSASDPSDKNSGIEQSAGGIADIVDDDQCATSDYATLCTWLTPSVLNKSVEEIKALIGDTTSLFPPRGVAVTGSNASTVSGFITNSMAIKLPGQPSIRGPRLSVKLIPDLAKANTNLSFDIKPACGKVKMLGCIGRAIMSGLFNMIKTISSIFTNMIAVWINNIIIILVSIPLASMQGSFLTGIEFLTKNPSANPIVVLAQMGVHYVNEPANLYVSMISQVLVAYQMPVVGFVLGPIVTLVLALASPLIVPWLGIMMTVGFLTAFYIPFLPYMLFTFGVIAWLTAVIEAMAAAPIVALSITHPEGEGILGNKGETALMILMNVFLRPSMMIIGYIAAIALSYVSVWIINSGFSRVLAFIQNGNMYNGWAGLYVFFFSILIYTTIYLTVVQKAFNLIYILPDQVLRWIGAQPEHSGSDSAAWVGDIKGQVEKGGTESDKGQSGINEKTFGKATGMVQDVLDKKGGGSTSVGASGSGGGGAGGGGAGGGGAGGGGAGGGGAAGGLPPIPPGAM